MRKDWFSFADAAMVAEEYLAGPQDLVEISPDVWGYPGLAVVCLGNRQQMRRVQSVRFYQKFHAGPCPRDYWGDEHGGPPLPTVYERLLAMGLVEANAPKPGPRGPYRKKDNSN